MRADQEYQLALSRLRGVRASKRPDVDEIVGPRDEVLSRYQPMFSSGHLPVLGAAEFREFLLFENNHHWTGLHRHVPKMCANMQALRQAVALLVDESRPLVARLDGALGMVDGMGKAVATAILLVAYPTKYGVWNSTSEGGLKTLGLWPTFGWGDTFGRRYEQVNQILMSLAADLEVDLWTLDALLWQLRGEESSKEDDVQVEPPDVAAALTPLASAALEHRFGLERHLHEFLRDNWAHTELGRDWNIYSEPGDDEAGYEYPCDVGRIDILAKHKTQPAWLVVELKREQSSDATVGQVLRYMGWVKHRMAAPGDRVEGVVIARAADQATHYALSATSGVDLLLYEVEFHLVRPSGPEWAA